MAQVASVVAQVSRLRPFQVHACQHFAAAICRGLREGYVAGPGIRPLRLSSQAAAMYAG